MPYEPSQFDLDILRPVCKGWEAVIDRAEKFKEECFGKDAAWAMAMYDGPDYGTGELKPENKKLIGMAGGSVPPPAFIMSVNKLAEVNQLYGPALYVRNPHVLVTPVKRPIMGPEFIGDPNDPNVQMFYQQAMQGFQMDHTLRTGAAGVLENYINWSQFELNKRRHARKWIQEAILKGMGVGWTELYQPPGMQFPMIGTFYDSVDNLLLDPDADLWDDMRYVIRRRRARQDEVEQRFGLEEGQLDGKGRYESTERQSLGRQSRSYQHRKRMKQHCDIIEYYEVFSKIGFGDRIAIDGTGGYKNKHVFDQFGDYCYLAIVKGLDYPLNLPPWDLEKEPQELFFQAQWPIPFWGGKDGWPMTELYFHDHPNCIYPTAHYKFARGEINFVNWSMSYLATKIATASTTIVAYMKAADDEIKQALSKSEGGYSHVEFSEGLGKKINELIQFLNPPPLGGDHLTMTQLVENNADKRLGLNDMMYGGDDGRQMRSAKEAALRGQYAATRPEDFADKTEDALSRMAAKESFAMRWLLQRPDVEPVVGPIGGMIWEKLISTTDVEAVVREFDYRVEAGSTRKPNKSTMQDQANQAVQNLGQILFAWAQGTGNVEPFNNLMRYWGKAMDYENIDSMLLPPPPPPQPDPAQQQAEAELQMKQAELEMKAQANQQQLQHKAQTHQLDMAQKQQESQFGLLESLIKVETIKETSDAKVKAAKAQAAAKPKPTSGKRKSA